KSIKELTNQEFLNLFKELPENKELKELLIKYKTILATSEQDMEQIPREIAEFSIPLKEGMEPKDMEQNPQEDKDEQIKKSLKKRIRINNMKIKKEDIYKTAFKYIYGIYVQLVMGFGYKDAPSIFQETMEKIFEPVIFEEFLSIYMDDILIKTNSEQEMTN